MSQDVGHNAGSLCPAGKTSTLYHLYSAHTHSLTHSKRFIPVRVVDDPVTASREYILVYPVLNPAF